MRNLIRAREVFMLFSILSGHAAAYDEDGHYYATALMALDINGGQPLSKELLTIVRSIQFVDDNPLTEPNGNGVENRRTRHFPVAGILDDAGNFYVTKRDSAFARHNVNKALSANDPYWLGMALHTYLDSYAHEGYGPIIGQASGGYDADRPHLATDKFRQMSEMAYTILQKWQKNNNKSSLNILPSMKYKELASFIPDGYSCAGLLNGTLGALSTKDGCRDYSQQVAEIAPRIKWWYSNTNSIFPDGYLPAYSRLTGDDQARFEGIIQVYKMPTSEIEADNRTWADIVSTSSKAAVRSASVTTKTTAEPATSGMSIKDLAQFSIENAANYIDGMDPRLINA